MCNVRIAHYLAFACGSLKPPPIGRFRGKSFRTTLAIWTLLPFGMSDPLRFGPTAL